MLLFLDITLSQTESFEDFYAWMFGFQKMKKRKAAATILVCTRMSFAIHMFCFCPQKFNTAKPFIKQLSQHYRKDFKSTRSSYLKELLHLDIQREKWEKKSKTEKTLIMHVI